MDKRFWGFLIAVVVILGGVFWATNAHKAKAPSVGNAKPTSHIEGQGKDDVTLVEYGDYECPFCGEYFPTVKQVQQVYNTQLFFQFRNLPLTQLHQNAFAGARAAEAAALQNQFWQMHDLLYENQNQWVSSNNPETFFDSYAQQLGLNVTKFKQDFASEQVNNVINADVAAFAQTKLQEATPTFLLDGKQIQPGNSVASFEQFINAEITKKGFKPPATTSTSSPTSSSNGQSVQ